MSVARPVSRAFTHLTVVGLVAFSAAFGVAATGAQSEGPAADQPFFSLVGTARAGGETAARQPDLTLSISPETALRQQQIARNGELAAVTPIAIPTPLAEPVAPPPATPEPARGTPQGTGSVTTVPVQGGAVRGSGGVLSWPVAGGVVTQYFHAGHLAVDIAAHAGNTVIAADAGVVTWAGWRSNGGGMVVQIDHGNGVVTVYNHLGSIWVSPGQAVSRGQGIAGVGCTGICTGPHVHFEVLVNGVIVNPMRYL
ncbi:MAG TPA: M23 family metallopeptidase [Candidatus Limnocylindria bacterium]|nr:M23 family metallopeptidase [Candidatus Limnocylindria bacterium]